MKFLKLLPYFNLFYTLNASFDTMKASLESLIKNDTETAKKLLEKYETAETQHSRTRLISKFSVFNYKKLEISK